MEFLQRAFLQNRRKKGKTLLMFLLLLVMGTMILTCFSIQTAMQDAALNVRQSLKGSFTVDAKATCGQLTSTVVDEILKTPGVKPSYNARSNGYAEFRSEDGNPLKVLTEGAFQVVEGFEHAGKLQANVFSGKDALFTESGFAMVAGQPITSGDQHVVLVHQFFAKQNGLVIGDTITLALNDEMLADETMSGTEAQARTVKATIIGTFTNTLPQEGSMLLSHVFYENMVFTDPLSYTQLYTGTDQVSFDYADFDVDDPAELDAIISSVQHIPSVDWDDCIFTQHDTDYENAKNALGTLGNMVHILVMVIILVSVVLLVLILALWMRVRVHETGVFLAMGFPKRDILLQHISEMLLIAVCAFAVSFFLSSAIAGTIGAHLLEQASTSEYQVERLTDIPSGDSPESPVSPDIIELTQIEVKVSAKELTALYLIGTALILLSVTIAACPVLRMNPKEILTKMS